MLHKWQYISQGSTPEWHYRHIQAALDNGAKWIQLRLKHQDPPTVLRMGRRVARSCAAYKAVFILNDDPELARQAGADGVHLGLNDCSVTIARKILGDGKIIGGTANTYADVLQRIDEGCDYIGLGPMRLTTTKEKLSPVLGLEGYRRILTRLKEQAPDKFERLRHSCPVYAIGAIQTEDVQALCQTGVHGIAVSGLLTLPEIEEKGKAYPYTDPVQPLAALENTASRGVGAVTGAPKQRRDLKNIIQYLNQLLNGRS